MSSIALIGTFYNRDPARSAEGIRAQTRKPDELWLLGETWDDVERITAQDWGRKQGWVVSLPTPRDGGGRYSVIPYSRKINYALERSRADYITYLTDDSWPAPEKLERMAAVLDENPEMGVVYCGQRRNGSEYLANRIVEDAYCVIDHTQVMHRRTDDRWPEDIEKMLLGDAHFWRALHARLGPFYPVPEGILDFVEQTKDGISASW